MTSVENDCELKIFDCLDLKKIHIYIKEDVCFSILTFL